MKSIKEKIRNLHLQHGNDQVTFKALEALEQWGGDLNIYAGEVSGIKKSTRLTQVGKQEDVGKKRADMLKRLVKAEEVQAEIEKNIKALDVSIINATFKAMESKATDPVAKIGEYMKEQEIRSLLPQLQQRQEQERQATVETMRANKQAVPDDLLQPVNSARDMLFHTAENFLNDNPATQANNRTMVRAILESPVPILSDADLAQGKAILSLSVAARQHADKEAAQAMLEANDIVFKGLERLIRNPEQIGAEHKPHIPVSDQERIAANA